MESLHTTVIHKPIQQIYRRVSEFYTGGFCISKSGLILSCRPTDRRSRWMSRVFWTAPSCRGFSMRIFRLLRKPECASGRVFVTYLFQQISLGAQKDCRKTDRLSRPKTCRWIRVLSADQELRTAITTTKSPTSELRRVTRTLRTAKNTAGEALREVPKRRQRDYPRSIWSKFRTVYTRPEALLLLQRHPFNPSYFTR